MHDGVRPCVPVALIEHCFAVAAQQGSAVPVISVTDSLRKKNGDNSHTVSRDALYAVQTPQVFRIDWLKEACRLSLSLEDREHFTDDASLYEAAGYPVYLTGGSRLNIKITEPDDLKVAELFLHL